MMMQSSVSIDFFITIRFLSVRLVVYVSVGKVMKFLLSGKLFIPKEKRKIPNLCGISLSLVLFFFNISTICLSQYAYLLKERQSNAYRAHESYENEEQVDKEWWYIIAIARAELVDYSVTWH